MVFFTKRSHLLRGFPVTVLRPIDEQVIHAASLIDDFPRRSGIGQPCEQSLVKLLLQQIELVRFHQNIGKIPMLVHMLEQPHDAGTQTVLCQRKVIFFGLNASVEIKTIRGAGYALEVRSC